MPFTLTYFFCNDILIHFYTIVFWPNIVLNRLCSCLLDQLWCTFVLIYYRLSLQFPSSCGVHIFTSFVINFFFFSIISFLVVFFFFVSVTPFLSVLHIQFPVPRQLQFEVQWMLIHLVSRLNTGYPLHTQCSRKRFPPRFIDEAWNTKTQSNNTSWWGSPQKSRT